MEFAEGVGMKEKPGKGDSKDSLSLWPNGGAVKRWRTLDRSRLTLPVQGNISWA